MLLAVFFVGALYLTLLPPNNGRALRGIFGQFWARFDLWPFMEPIWARFQGPGLALSKKPGPERVV